MRKLTHGQSFGFSYMFPQRGTYHVHYQFAVPCGKTGEIKFELRYNLMEIGKMFNPKENIRIEHIEVDRDRELELFCVVFGDMRIEKRGDLGLFKIKRLEDTFPCYLLSDDKAHVSLVSA